MSRSTRSTRNYLLLLVVFLQSTSLLAQNLIQNGDAEIPLDSGEIPSWTEAVGTAWTYRSSNPSPRNGANYFFPGAVASAELRQDVDVSGYAVEIDAGSQQFEFFGYVRSFDQTPTDEAQIVIEYLDETTAVIESFQSSNIGSTDVWERVVTPISPPVGTRTLRIRLIATRNSGSNNDAYFDNLVLREATVPDGAGSLTCSTPVSGSLSIPGVSDLGGLCGEFACYSCGSPFSNLGFTSEEDVYEFSCQVTGPVTVHLDNADCDLDLFVLDDSADPFFGCLEGDTSTGSASSNVTFNCVAGETYTVVVETDYTTESCIDGDGYDLYVDVGSGSGCLEDCDNGIDDDLNADMDCGDTACWSDPVCLDCDLDLRVFLEGAYAGNDSMHVSPAFSAAVPAGQPFADAVFAGTPLETDTTLSVGAWNADDINWVHVSVRTGAGPETEVLATPAILRKDGLVVDTSRSGFTLDGLLHGSYYVVVRERNHLPVMTPSPLDCSSGSCSWDFTTGLGQAYANPGAPMKVMLDSRTVMISGDISIDGQITASDFNHWLTDTKTAATGYQQSDITLDAQVTVSDFNLWLTNTKLAYSSQVP